jgi:hypothetical protein
MPTFEQDTFRTEAMNLLQHEPANTAELDLMITENVA